MAWTFHLVIPDPSGTRVLLVEDGAGWTLPRVSATNDFGDRFAVTEASTGVRAQFGLDIVVLRAVSVEYDDADESMGEAFFFTENLTERSPLIGDWCGEEAVASITGREREPSPSSGSGRGEREGWNDCNRGNVRGGSRSQFRGSERSCRA